MWYQIPSLPVKSRAKKDPVPRMTPKYPATSRSLPMALLRAREGVMAPIRDMLARQLYSPVQWVATIETMVAGGASRIVECGPGKVLAGLIRRIDRSIDTGFIHDYASLEKTLAA